MLNAGQGSRSLHFQLGICRLMDEIVRETLEIVDKARFMEFSIGTLSKDNLGVFYTAVEILIDGDTFRKKVISGDSQFTCLMSAIFYIGNNIRDISKNHGLKVDLFGLTFDEYIPLSKGQRDAWGE